MNDRDIDAEFDAIVSRWDDDAASPPGPRTVHDITAAYAALSRPEVDPPSPADGADEVVEADRAVDADRAQEASHEVAAAPVEQPAQSPAGAAPEPEAWRQGPSTDDEDDHFEPPPVQLPPGEDIGYWGALLGLIGGPLVLLWVVLSTPFYAGWWTLGAILMFFGGFALLVMRQPKDRDPFDNDNGARV